MMPRHLRKRQRLLRMMPRQLRRQLRKRQRQLRRQVRMTQRQARLLPRRRARSQPRLARLLPRLPRSLRQAMIAVMTTRRRLPQAGAERRQRHGRAGLAVRARALPLTRVLTRVLTRQQARVLAKAAGTRRAQARTRRPQVTAGRPRQQQQQQEPRRRTRAGKQQRQQHHHQQQSRARGAASHAGPPALVRPPRQEPRTRQIPRRCRQAVQARRLQQSLRPQPRPPQQAAGAPRRLPALLWLRRCRRPRRRLLQLWLRCRL
jgi:hypothetical protein